MDHLITHILMRWVLSPIFYWLGFAMLKVLSAGKARILPYDDFHDDDDLAWYEFRVYRGFRKFCHP